MLVEFKSEENVKNILKNCASHQNDIDSVAVVSPFLWFRAAPSKKEKLSPVNASLTSCDGSANMDEDCLIEDLMKCSSISDQIQLLYDRTTLDDIGTRLRYIVARQVSCY